MYLLYNNSCPWVEDLHPTVAFIRPVPARLRIRRPQDSRRHFESDLEQCLGMSDLLRPGKQMHRTKHIKATYNLTKHENYNAWAVAVQGSTWSQWGCDTRNLRILHDTTESIFALTDFYKDCTYFATLISILLDAQIAIGFSADTCHESTLGLLYNEAAVEHHVCFTHRAMLWGDIYIYPWTVTIHRINCHNISTHRSPQPELESTNALTTDCTTCGR